ncbi:MAG: hypothetical protein ACYC5N_10290 [Endomicrobiales bacterium]
MKTKILPSSSEPFSYVLLRNKERILAVLIGACFVINGLVPRHRIAADEYEVLSQIMQQQSALLRFFSFSSLPVKLVNDLFSEYHDMAADPSGKTPREGQKKSPDTSSDYSLVSFDKTGMNRPGFAQRVSEGVPAAAGAFQPLPVTPDAGSTSPPGERHVFLLLLLFLFLLPRSSLSEGAVRAFSFRGYGARLACSSRVFYLPEKAGISHGR